MSFNRWMDKKYGKHINWNFIQHDKKETHPSVIKWLDLGSIMPSEVTETKKDKYCIISHICGIQKS